MMWFGPRLYPRKEPGMKSFQTWLNARMQSSQRVAAVEEAVRRGARDAGVYVAARAAWLVAQGRASAAQFERLAQRSACESCYPELRA